MPESNFVDGIIREMKTRPYSMIVLLALLVAVPYIWINYAKAADVAQLTRQVAAIEISIRQAALETQLRAINTELFALKQKVLDLQSAHKDVDPIYRDRISQLESDKGQIELALEALAKSGP